MDNLNQSSETKGLQPDGEGWLDEPDVIGRYRVIRRLGQGGFGRVYLAGDDDLVRLVAIKVPNPERVAGPEDVEIYLAEARALAKLEHPHIVPVYDVGRTGDGLCYVVSKYIDGSDLAARLRQGRPPIRESVGLAAVVADALHHAHTRGLIHRDIKPANILLDASNRAWVADFGLALKDEDYGTGARCAGTPAYMSPEQARGEGHRVDGRSDLFSLGVVLYELLTGWKPFRGDSRTEVMDQIANAEPRPLRQIDDTVPRELDRICQKALAKRSSERYSTGQDMAEDLRHFLETQAAPLSPGATPTMVAPTHLTTLESAPVAHTPVRSDVDGRAVMMVPKGLRSFDRHDADFFVELLPGPRDREGLPESLRFWKTRIETTDADATFRVGLLYGPSGCGKSSLVKAGLLPRLSKRVLPVYIEATPAETEAHLLRSIRKACPELSTALDLVETLARLRAGRVLRAGQKILLVLDQFEQWLFARRGEPKTELVAALRQCDGEHVQAVVMVRDDFWMAATRFMRDLEIRLVEGENSAAVDLFDLPHARRVLAAFGCAYRALPEKTSELSHAQRAFLEQSVAGLAQDGKVIPVRLALFAEMVKGKSWAPATLRDVGGTQGVGVTFLDETFSASTAPPEHRLHQRAAQAVLKALLPRTGKDIKGQMRSETELRAASGYASRPGDFTDVIAILDHDLRLITPSDPEAWADETEAISPGDERYYQLTHDYLVHSLRDWLTRKQTETRRGLAELRLAERVAIWDTRPENRHLPSIVEWASIRALTRSKDWTDPQRRMMGRAGRVHGLRAIGLASVLAVLAALGLNAWNRVVAANRAAASAAASRVQVLLKAETNEIPGIIQSIHDERRWTDPELKRVVTEPWYNPKAKLNASLALLPVDPTQVKYLESRLRDAAPGELPVLRNALLPYESGLKPDLWSHAASANPGDHHLLPVAAALALYDADNPSWAGYDAKVAQALVTVGPEALESWLDLLRPVRTKLTNPLAAIFRDKTRPEPERILATRSLADYGRDDPEVLAELLMAADVRAYRALFPIIEHQAEKTTRIFQAELAKKATFSWDDPPIDPSWTTPDPALAGRIEQAQGLLDDRFAFCQTMPLGDFRATAEGLRPSGFRPVRFRPYSDGSVVRVAAVWTRDGKSWRQRSGLSSLEIQESDERNRSEKFVAVDVAGYVTMDESGRPIDRYGALWVEAPDDLARMYVAATADAESEIHAGLKESELVPRTLHAMYGLDGRTRYSGVWGRASADGAHAHADRDLFEGNFAASRARRTDQVLMDVVISRTGQPQTIAERAQIALERAEKTLRSKPGNLDARKARALAYLRLGATAKAMPDLDALVGADNDDAEPLLYRTIALARLGQQKAARDDLTRFANADAPKYARLYLETVVASELGDGKSSPTDLMDAALAKDPQDVDLRYAAARAFACASQALAGRDRAKSCRLADRALRLLEEAVREGDADFGRMNDDPALDPIRDLPEFAAIMKAGHPERRNGAVWSTRGDLEYQAVDGLTPDEHQKSARRLAAQHYRPVAWSVAQIAREGPPVTASIWHRPVVSEDEKDQLAARQARAAIALMRLGKADEVWPLLKHSADPRLRTFIINWLSPMGVRAPALAAELARLDRAAADRGRSADPEMDDVLFDRETSIRRALIQVLGTLGADGFTSIDKDPLVEKLLEIYRTDPDAGIHGAAEWTLRRWKQQEKLKAADAELMQLKARGQRRWFLTSQGQTFTVIDGPVEFRMGSPGTEPERNAESEPSRSTIIPRRFAIGTKEVTVEQFERFVQTNDRFALDRSTLKQYSPDPDGPWISANWYGAAAYCNWLSEREGLPPSQWCYRPNEAGAYAQGMTIPADVLERTGYRLPTEAEWEFACRAGTVTSRYHGVSVDLLENYAWYQTNSQQRAWGCARLLPNELGLFDMLGNVYEWCQDRSDLYRPEKKGISRDSVLAVESVIDKRVRTFRSGSNSDLSSVVRSAARAADFPTLRSTLVGFRPARTCP